MRMGPHMLMPGDAAAVKGKKLQRRSLRRAWRFADPYRRTIVVFLVAIVLAALVELVAPFAFRTIIDTAIPHNDRGLISTLAAVVVGAALLDAGLAIVQRWCSARIGEGLIFDLREESYAQVED
ncbi:MAG: ABC transporter transmembrane domain-containing protein, partial [Actinomycetota bacterium]